MPTNMKSITARECLEQGKLYEQQGNIKQSIASYEQAIELNPNSILGSFKLADIYRNQKEYDKAFTYYLKVAYLKPKRAVFFKNIGRVAIEYSKILLKKNDIDSAINAYREFIKKKHCKSLNQNKIDKICNTLGELILKLSVRQGEFRKAVTFFQDAINSYPYKIWSYYHLGDLLVKQNEIDEAIVCYKKVLEIRPKFSLGLLSLGMLLLKKGHRNKAFQCGLEILQYQGGFKNIRLNRNLVKLLSIRPSDEKSEVAFQKAVEKIEASDSSPDLNLIIYRNLGKILQDRKKHSEASKFYQKSLRLSLEKSKPEFVKNYWDYGKFREPNFSVIGFGKCGTTAFYDYLCQHPLVLPAVGKEPMYIYYDIVQSKDFATKNWNLPCPERELYLAHFAPRTEDSEFITGEASTTNVLTECGTIIASWFPQIKIIAIVREPVRRTISHYEQLLKVGGHKRTLEAVINSELEAFEAATDIAQLVAKRLRHGGWREHIAMSLYVYPLEKWMNLLPREQFLILTNEDLAQYPAETMKQAFDFLGLPECNSIEYNPRNVGSYPKIDADLLSRLTNFFRPHNQRLENLLGRKLNWDD